MIGSPTHRRAEVLPIALLLIFVAAFYLATLRQGHHWGDDFALYIHHARNLSEGLPYLATGNIQNPQVPHLGPLFYPPGYPLLLSPVYKLFGLNLTALKTETVLTFVCSLLFVFLLFRDRLPYWWNITLLACFALNPFVWSVRDDITSDLAFMLFAYGAFYLIHLLYSNLPGKIAGAPVAPVYALPVSVLIYLAYAVRPMGFLIALALVLYDLGRNRKITLFPVLTAAAVAGLAAAQELLLAHDTRFGLFRFDYKWLAFNTFQYVKDYRVFWLNGASSLVSYALFLVILLVTLAGIWFAFREGPRVYDIFAILYMGLVIAYSTDVNRYLIPLAPVLILYAFLGLRQILQFKPVSPVRIAVAGLAALIVFSYGSVYAKADLGPIREGMADPDFANVCQYIEATTRPSDRFLFRKPRLLSLMTDRPAAVYPPTSNPADLLTFAHSIGAAYLILANIPHEDFAEDSLYLQGLTTTYRDRVRSVYQNAHYQLFQIQDQPNTPPKIGRKDDSLPPA
jgi:hypothetical protein